MKPPILTLLSIASLRVIAQDTIPDRWEETYEHTIGYWENKGQNIDLFGDLLPDLSFYSEGARPRMLLHEGSRISMMLTLYGMSVQDPDTSYLIDLFPIGELATEVDPVGQVVKTHFMNFFTSNTMPGGVTEVHGYNRVVYPGMWPGIDMHFYSGSRGQKMSLVCWPGSDPEQMTFQFAGHDSLRVDQDSLLRIFKEEKWIDLPEAVAYQVDANNEVIPLNWTAEWEKLSESVVKFIFDGYDPSLPLVLQIGPRPLMQQEVSEIPPCWGALFGGDDEERVHSSAVDDDGNYFVAGTMESSGITFPSQPGGPFIYGAGDLMIWVARFNSDHELIWTLLYGGLSYDQYPYGLAVRNGPSTEIYVAGSTTADNFYFEFAGGAYFDNTGSSFTNNGFFGRFDIDGDCLLSTYFGNENTQVLDIDVDPQGRLILAGQTGGPVPFPGTQPAGSFVQDHVFGSDGFVVALDEDDDLRWGTCVGDSAFDLISSVRATADGYVVAGYTNSANYQPIQDGGPDAWDEGILTGSHDLTVAEFDHDGAIQWSSLIGSTQVDVIDAGDPLAVDAAGNVYVVAQSPGVDWPFEPGIGWYSTAASTHRLLKFSGTDRGLAWSTPIGEPYFFSPTSLRTDAIGNLFIAGGHQGEQMTTQELPGFYFQTDPNSGNTGSPSGYTDGVLLCFTPDHYLTLATYVGGDDWGFVAEQIATIACNDDFVYAAGFTSWSFVPDTSYFPVYFPGGTAWADSVYGGGETDGFVMGFCKGLFTALSPRPGAARPLTAVPIGEDQWFLVGLPDGPMEFVVHDASGRLVNVYRRQVRFGRSETIDLWGLASGTYSITAPAVPGAVCRVALRR